jgi:DNA-binding protein HU-beta
MSLNKTKLAAQVAEETGVSQTQALMVLNAAIQSVTKALAAGESVSLTGFGAFRVTERSERPGRNPKTGEALTIPAGKRVSFTASKKMKDSI